MTGGGHFAPIDLCRIIIQYHAAEKPNIANAPTGCSTAGSSDNASAPTPTAGIAAEQRLEDSKQQLIGDSRKARANATYGPGKTLRSPDLCRDGATGRCAGIRSTE